MIDPKPSEIESEIGAAQGSVTLFGSEQYGYYYTRGESAQAVPLKVSKMQLQLALIMLEDKTPEDVEAAIVAEITDPTEQALALCKWRAAIEYERCDSTLNQLAHDALNMDIDDIDAVFAAAKPYVDPSEE